MRKVAQKIPVTRMKLDAYCQMEDDILSMRFQPNDDYDSWFPTIEEIKDRITEFHEEDIAFLTWIFNCPDPKEEQKQVISYAKELLQKHLKIVEGRGRKK